MHLIGQGVGEVNIRRHIVGYDTSLVRECLGCTEQSRYRDMYVVIIFTRTRKFFTVRGKTNYCHEVSSLQLFLVIMYN